MEKAIIADQRNADSLIQRFQKFIEENALKGFSFEVRRTSNDPQKKETWSENPKNHHKLSVIPKVGKVVTFYSFQKECLLSVQPQSEKDVLNIHFSGVREWFREHYPDEIDFTKTTFNSFVLEVGDKVLFKNEGIIVIPKRPDSITKEIRSWMLLLQENY